MSDLVALERSVRLALPAGQEIAAPGWVVRISGGATKRVNSANPVAPGARIADVRGAAEALYAAHGLPPRFRLTPLAEAAADAMLADAGYAAIDASFTMIAPAAASAGDPAIHFSAVSDPERLAGFARASGWTAAQQAVHAGLLTRLPPVRVFATLMEDGEAIGFGVASVAEGVAWLFDIAVVPVARGRGVGRRLVAALLDWAAAQGCARVGLQVLADNEPARRLYRSLGFRDAYPYHYRIRRD